MTWRQIVRLAGAGALVAASGCGAGQQGSPGAAESPSAREPGGQAASGASADGWRSLFDGSSLAGWRVYRSQQQPTGWSAGDGVLSKSAPTDDIITVGQFGDFELEFEWRIAPRGNAGLVYRATEEYDRVWKSAVEYQLLDDAGAPGVDPRTAAGAAYALYAAPAGKSRPAGEWNAARIVARGARVEHWLNGEKLLEYDLSSPDWEARVKESKFREWPTFGRARRGHIAIQGDHAGELSLRHIRIREL